MKPRIFLGSASESWPVVQALHAHLKRHIDVTPWKLDPAKPSEYGLEWLLGHLDKVQFAAFVLTGDDLALIRGKPVEITRDNVLFELGLFMGRLGRRRCFALVPGSGSVHLPSDLKGLTVPYFDNKRTARARNAAVKPACRIILSAVREQTPRLSEPARQAAAAVIEAAARQIARRAGSGCEVRGFFRLYDPFLGLLVPAAEYMGGMPHGDQHTLVPCNPSSKKKDWWLISRSFRERSLVCADVNWNVKLDTDKGTVWRDLQALIAHPVGPPGPRAEPIGTIDFNCARPLAEMGWEKDKELQYIVKLVANALYRIATKVY